MFISLRRTQPIQITIENALKKVSAEMGDVEVLIYDCRDNFTACAPLEMSYLSMLETYNFEVVGAFAAATSVLPDMISKLHCSNKCRDE